MTIIYDPQLEEYMRKRHKTHILVDIASSNTSDFDVTELYLRFITDSHAKSLLSADKGYRSYPAPLGEMIFPPYHMHIGDEIRVELGSFLFFHWLKQTGLKL